VLVGIGPKMTKNEALKLEYRIKKLPADEKITELTWMEDIMTISKRDLQALKKDIKELQKKMENLIVAAGKSDKPKIVKKSKAKPARLKTTTKVPAKKAPAKKGAAKVTATDQVLEIINRSKKEVNAAALMKKTGFDLKKVRNILHRSYKKGKIKRAGKGIYVGA
jgi:predicted Rossmann fold nucleotide-binding protein DprA/Smf involved in DNA uptake